jgi:hypothetical protein
MDRGEGEDLLVDGDPPRLDLFRFRDREVKHAVFEGGFNLLGVDPVG